MSSNALTAGNLGFRPIEHGWEKRLGQRTLHFRRLRSRSDLKATEALQREVFGVSDEDLISYSILVVIHRTGGEVLGAFDGEALVGFISAYGGFVDGAPRLISDIMAVSPAYRGGVGFALKTLQAAVALQAGFSEVRWTVDPLRAANARLNVERLGAVCHHYERNVYGENYAGGLYGGLPSDRLDMRWLLDSGRVRERLLTNYQPLPPNALAALPEYDPSTTPAEPRYRLAIPGDIDALLVQDIGAAREHRLRVRAALEAAFSAGYLITGFAGERGLPVGYYLIERRSTGDG
jgi:predicted GNAT superfamily acetyltransferase